MLAGRDLRVNWATPDAAGGFGCVYFGQDDSGEEVVVKVAFKDEFAEKLLANELHFNRKLRDAVPEHHGRRWAAFIGSCWIPNSPDFPAEVSRKQALVFKREKGATLDDYLASDDSSAALHEVMGIRGVKPKSRVRVALFVKVLGELLCSILQLHREGLIHRDIKPENILVVPEDQDCPIKLIDLGSAADMSSAVRRGLRDATIDPLYAPPELRVDMMAPTSFDTFTAGVTCLRVLLPSLGKNPSLLKDIIDVELPAVDWNLRRWINQRAKGDTADETTWEARAMQDPALEPILAILDPMLRRNPADRPEPQQLLRQLGPVWEARLDAVEILTPLAPPMGADLANRLMRELRTNPTALAGLISHGVMTMWEAVAPIIMNLPRNTFATVSAVSHGTMKVISRALGSVGLRAAA